MNRLKYRVFDKRDDNLKEILGYTFSLEFPELVHIQWKNGTYEPSIYLKDLIFCQCTGFKDKNSKLIYENDIVKLKRGDYELYAVKWHNKSWEFKKYAMKCNRYVLFKKCKKEQCRKCSVCPDFRLFGATSLLDFSECEIVGNIFENFDILEDNLE